MARVAGAMLSQMSASRWRLLVLCTPGCDRDQMFVEFDTARAGGMQEIGQSAAISPPSTMSRSRRRLLEIVSIAAIRLHDDQRCSTALGMSFSSN
jgi:hypothetical protein